MDSLMVDPDQWLGGFKASTVAKGTALRLCAPIMLWEPWGIGDLVRITNRLMKKASQQIVLDQHQPVGTGYKLMRSGKTEFAYVQVSFKHLGFKIAPTKRANPVEVFYQKTSAGLIIDLEKAKMSLFDPDVREKSKPRTNLKMGKAPFKTGTITGPLPNAINAVNDFVDRKMVTLEIDERGRLRAIASIVIDGTY